MLYHGFLPDHNDILIDAGNTSDGSKVVNYLKSHGMDDTLEIVIATHPHEDHIGGLPAVYSAFKVKDTIDSGMYADTAAYKSYSDGAHKKGEYWEVDNNQTFTYGNFKLQIFTGAGYFDYANDYSVVSRLDTGDVEFLFWVTRGSMLKRLKIEEHLG